MALVRGSWNGMSIAKITIFSWEFWKFSNYIGQGSTPTTLKEIFSADLNELKYAKKKKCENVMTPPPSCENLQFSVAIAT